MIRFTPLTRLIALSVALATSSLPAGAQSLQPFKMSFGAFRADQTTEYQATPGGDVYEAGFGLFAAYGSGARNALGTWGLNDDIPELKASVPRNLGANSAAMWGTAFGERMDLAREDSYLFNLKSIDLAHLYARSYLLSGTLSPITLWFYGFNSLGQNTAALQQSFTIPVPSVVDGDITPELSTYFFNGNFQNLSGLAWFQQSGPTNAASAGSAFSHQFTNIEGELITPEPSTYVLMGTGLVALFAARRRRSVV